jgi:tetratricopeptide (TPR) repeat protein
MTSTVELLDIPVTSIFIDDSAPDLLIALEGYDAENWDLAKRQLEPIARAGNRLALFKYANTLDSLGDEVAAEHYWRLAVAGGDIKAGINLANLFKDRGQNHDEIIRLYNLAIDAGNVDAIRNLALYIEDDDPNGAEALYLRAVEAGDAKSCANLALQHFTEGNVEEALKFAELGFQRGSMYSVTLIALQHSKREEWDLALAEAKRALTLSTPENFDDQQHPYKLIALALIQLLRFDEAERAIQDCYDHGIPETDSLKETLNMARGNQHEVAPVQAELTPKFCTDCGTRAQAGNLFCTNCGNKL